MASPISSTSPILIIGAGIVGLTLAQALTKSHIPFRIFDRDASPTSRSPGWGITVHWALPALLSCLPPHVAAKLETAQVDPEQGRCDTGQFLVLNLKTAEPVYIIPPAPRMRLSRKKLRGVLMEGVHVEWGKGLEELRMTDEGVEVSFDDGTVIKGAICVGADGASSRMRRKLSPETAQLVQLPVRMIGVTVRLTPEKIDLLRAIDPLLFQGIHPDTGTFLWFSVLSTPEANGSLGADEYYEGQVLVSWKVKSSEEEPPLSSRERVGLMKSLAMSFEERLRTLVYDIPDDTEVIEIRIRDWPYVIWPNHDGKVTLIGDAAHAMTMCM
jgi:2-polyprenyl-6-methoxyphenol hydroxylase-like FAD-dependent oxidoreductase